MARVWTRGRRSKTQGSNPWNIYGDRGSFYFYLVREIALAESSRETRKIYPRYFALSPVYPDPLSPRRSIRLFLFGKPDVLSVARFRTILHGFFSRGEKRRCFSYARRKIPFIFASRIRWGAFECHQRNMLMPVGTMKARSWTAMESRISIKAIEASMCSPLCDFVFTA